MTEEGKIKEKIKDLLNKYGCYWFMPVANMYSRKGIPDFIACCRGKFIAIEAKSSKGKLTKLQELELGKISAAGGLAFVIRDDAGLKKLEDFLRD